MTSPEHDLGLPSDGSRAAIWRLIRQQAHQLATLRRNPTDRELDDFTRLVETLPAPRALRPGR
jgi:hypothetical protein